MSDDGSGGTMNEELDNQRQRWCSLSLCRGKHARVQYGDLLLVVAVQVLPLAMASADSQSYGIHWTCRMRSPGVAAARKSNVGTGRRGLYPSQPLTYKEPSGKEIWASHTLAALQMSTCLSWLVQDATDTKMHKPQSQCQALPSGSCLPDSVLQSISS